MALSKDDIKNQFPLPAYNYKVEIGGQSIGFSQVSGLSLSIPVSTYKESRVDEGKAGPNTMRMPGQQEDITLTLQKGVIRQKSLPILYNWISAIKLNLVEKKDIKIDLCDEEGNAVITWNVMGAFPTSLEAPSFDATSTDAAIESMSLVADSLIMQEN